MFLEERSYDKVVTVVDGLDDGSRDLEGLASELKKSFGCGGIFKNGASSFKGIPGRELRKRWSRGDFRRRLSRFSEAHFT